MSLEVKNILLNLKYSDTIVTSIDLILNGKATNFLNVINKNIKLSNKASAEFDRTFEFYLVEYKTFSYVLGISLIATNCVVKTKYNLNGSVISSVRDTIHPNLGSNYVVREIKDKTVYLKDNNVIKTTSLIEFKPITKDVVDVSKVAHISNPNIGVIDIETYTDNLGISRVFCLEFKTNLASDTFTYYIDRNLDSSVLVLNLINELLRPKYSDITFYAHNLGGFDIVFVLKILYDFNDTQLKENKYDISSTLRDDKIIKVLIRKKGNKLTIQDSYCILPSSLSKLGKDFEVNTIK